MGRGRQSAEKLPMESISTTNQRIGAPSPPFHRIQGMGNKQIDAWIDKQAFKTADDHARKCFLKDIPGESSSTPL
jgi:hypothetical protein